MRPGSRTWQAAHLVVCLREPAWYEHGGQGQVHRRTKTSKRCCAGVATGNAASAQSSTMSMPRVIRLICRRPTLA